MKSLIPSTTIGGDSFAFFAWTITYFVTSWGGKRVVLIFVFSLLFALVFVHKQQTEERQHVFQSQSDHLWEEKKRIYYTPSRVDHPDKIV